MSGLTEQDIAQLQQYVDAGDRYSYWKYLEEKGDTYAKLALGVVTNETKEGYIANEFLKDRGDDVGVVIDDQKNWDIGVDLMEADIIARKQLIDDGKSDGLNIPVEPIYKYHKDVFNDYQLGSDNEAWTAGLLLREAINDGDTARANAIWQELLKSDFWSQIGVAYFEDLNVPTSEAKNWVKTTTAAFLEHLFNTSILGTKAISARNIDNIDGYSYDQTTGEWYYYGLGGIGSRQTLTSYAEKLVTVRGKEGGVSVAV
jgi:hypothetical protein